MNLLHSRGRLNGSSCSASGCCMDVRRVGKGTDGECKARLRLVYTFTLFFVDLSSSRIRRSRYSFYHRFTYFLINSLLPLIYLR
ncbi:hypothetical protein HHX47_DHR1000358 [Lentinula edodes]|nr:hypothetical protein HHX47_DHR1000358 [Lentinula edodes]